jgi:uncharacterized membrane protein
MPMRESSDENSILPAIFPERGDKTTRVEGFVDAAFAFAVTLLVISGDHLPHSVNDLILALKNVPTFAASFMLILVFWTGHAQWSRHYGLDDATTRRLSLLLVFLVLIFVYPLRMVFASLFALVTGGWLPANFAIGVWSDIPALFVTFGVAYGAMCTVMWLLYRHAWDSRSMLGLSRAEGIAARMSEFRWALLMLLASISILVALLILRVDASNWGWQLGLPGYVYLGNTLLRPFVRRYERRLYAQDVSD